MRMAKARLAVATLEMSLFLIACLPTCRQAYFRAFGIADRRT